MHLISRGPACTQQAEARHGISTQPTGNMGETQRPDRLTQPPAPVVLVCASTQPSTYFGRATLLGRCLDQFPANSRPKLALAAGNSGPQARGLPEIYNQAIESLTDDAVLVFVHDDVFFHDWNLQAQLQLALERFDVVGLVGCLKAQPDQPGWSFRLGPDGLPQRIAGIPASGSLNHFDPQRLQPCVYGPAPQACELLDGVLLAARNRVLRSTGLRFDPRFRFHCYDTDFCRSAQQLGLRLGTWPIACTHASPGNFSGSWTEAAKLWLQKWSPSAPS